MFSVFEGRKKKNQQQTTKSPNQKLPQQKTKQSWNLEVIPSGVDIK